MSTPLAVADLVVEHSATPVGVDVLPRFGWTVQSSAESVEQTAFRIVASHRGETLWDSGIVREGGAREFEYAGPVLPSLARIRWEVTVWGRQTVEPRESGVASASSWFVTGILGPGVEHDQWAAAAWRGGRTGSVPAPLLRSEFRIPRPTVSEAYLLVAAGGYARVELNGSLVDPSTLSPGFTDYDRRVQYTVTDVSALVEAGANAVCIELGRGFYAMRRRNTWEWHRSPWTAERCVRVMLVTRSPDGETQTYTTADGRWVCAEGPTREDDLYAGEDFDVHGQRGGCGVAGYDDGDWEAAPLVAGPRGALEAQRQPPIEATQVITPELVGERASRRLYDVGRVISGQVDITVTGPEGEIVQITHAERLDGDGRPDVSDPQGYYDGRFQTHRLTLAGSELRWRPRFSYQGFRYIEVVSEQPPTVRAVVVHTRARRTGSFACSDALLARIHELTVRTMEINLHGLPTDTPTFEKNGWTGDAMLGAHMMLTNLDTHQLLAKWVDDVIDSRRGGAIPAIIAPIGGWSMDWTPAPPWHAALVLVPWEIYEHTGDTRVLRTAWAPIVDYLRVELARSADGIASTTLGDWVGPDTDPGGGNPDEDLRVSATAFLAMMCDTAARIARVLGEPTREWRTQAERVRVAFIAEFFDEEGEFVRGRDERSVRQSHQVLALAAGLVPADRISGVLDALVSDIRRRETHLDTGALATKWLLPVLTRHGRADVALEIATQRTFPSWGFWIDSGATSLWEHWHPDSRSRGHYFLGTIDDWLFRDVAGLEAVEPGWSLARIAPRFTDRLDHATAEVETPYGRLAVSWRRTADRLRMLIDVPVGVTVEVDVPGAQRVLGSGRHEVMARCVSRDEDGV